MISSAKQDSSQDLVTLLNQLRPVFLPVMQQTAREMDEKRELIDRWSGRGNQHLTKIINQYKAVCKRMDRLGRLRALVDEILLMDLQQEEREQECSPAPSAAGSTSGSGSSSAPG
jgi:hypothetical protein